MNNEKKIILIILAFFWIFSLLYSLMSISFSMDEYNYMNRASSFLKGSFGQDNERFPFFPFVLSIFYFVFGESEIVSKLFPFLIGAIGVFLTYFLSKKFFGKDSAFWAASFLAANPIYLFISTRVLTESLFISLLVLNVIIFFKSIEDNRFFPLLGVSFALLFLTRYVGLYLLPVFAIYVLKKKPSLLLGKWFLLSFFSFFIVLYPWIAFNQNYTSNPFGGLSTFLFLSGEVKHSLPDKIPDYFVVFPFILFFLTPLLFFGLIEFWKEREKESNFLILLCIVVILVSIELHSFILKPPLLRYMAPLLPFLAIVASFGVYYFNTVIKIGNKLIVLLIFLNLLLGLLFVQYFSSYSKHVAYREAGKYISENCATVESNIPLVTEYYLRHSTGNNAFECFVQSSFESWKISVPENSLKIFNKNGISIFVKND